MTIPSAQTQKLSNTALRWNFWFMGWDIAFFTAALSVSSISTILPLFVSHITKENWLISLLISVRALGSFLPMLLVASFAERRQRLKNTLLYLTVLERIPFLLLAIAAITITQINSAAMLIFFFIMIFMQAAGGGLTYTPWLDIVSRAIPEQMRGRFLGGWVGAGNILGIFGAALATYFIANFFWPINFALCFLASFILVSISFVLLTFIKEPIRESVHLQQYANTAKPKLYAWATDMYTVIAQDKPFRRYLMISVIYGAAQIGMGLIAISALKQAHLSAAEVGLDTPIVAASLMFGYFLWGFIGDHLGHRASLVWSSVFGAFSMLFALLAHSFILVTLAFICYGLNSSGFQLSQMTYVLEFGAPARRPVYLGLASLIMAPFASLFPLFGGILADTMGYTPVFFAGIVFNFLAAAGFQWYSKNPAQLSAQSK